MAGQPLVEGCMTSWIAIQTPSTKMLGGPISVAISLDRGYWPRRLCPLYPLSSEALYLGRGSHHRLYFGLYHGSKFTISIHIGQVGLGFELLPLASFLPSPIYVLCLLGTTTPPFSHPQCLKQRARPGITGYQAMACLGILCFDSCSTSWGPLPP
ncbi:hypothetical protein, variant [Cladophialophora immunda]|uniref:Uncharacterized protein n=1 Tax=Cladophialophora immunda TaxID=569365 RepID=A0A0D2CC70_9EURO|nr:uncharacterized protein PV07_07649 [Cladophialophora immunda]XP_016248172.1 hypothetical protein, variant [Cladophialophora immunda]KIW27955.1 hypothetical protein PV07_07649 [Cladophialophora immunda]KIW27956.1 hypothetical protein, variant [Cladophialophora immunda]